jgi:hypothetical protein
LDRAIAEIIRRAMPKNPDNRFEAHHIVAENVVRHLPAVLSRDILTRAGIGINDPENYPVLIRYIIN